MAALSLNRHTTPRPGGVVFTARGVPAPRAAGAPARRFPQTAAAFSRVRSSRPPIRPRRPHQGPRPPRLARAHARRPRLRRPRPRPVPRRRPARRALQDDRGAAQAPVQGQRPETRRQEIRLVDRLLEHEFGTTDDEADIDPREEIVGLAGRRAERGVGGGVSARWIRRGGAPLRLSTSNADAAYSALGFDDGGYSRSSEARGDQGPAADSSYAARLMGRDGGGFDDGGGSGWGDDDWDDRDTAPEAPPEPTAEEIKAAAKARAREERLSLQKRSAMVAALRQLAFEREGFESDPRVHLEAVSRAIERAYRDMRWSKFAKMDPRSREACVDINVAAGTLTVLAQRVGRGGTVEWEVDDTEAFLEAHGKRHQLRKLARMFSRNSPRR